MWNPTNATAGVWLGTVGATGTWGLPTTTTVYTSVTRSRYSNVVNTANQIGARNTELMYTRGSMRYKGFLFYARAGMDVCNGGAFCWNAHSNYSISGPFCFKQHRRVCIDAGDLEQLVF
jgi:hypothetical protein